MAKTIYFVRHCAAAGQEADAPITEAGVLQAERLASLLCNSGVQRIVSSPYRRACQSIMPLAERLGQDVETDIRLTERVLCAGNCPDWMDRLRASFSDFDLCLPGGESSRTATARAIAAIEDCLKIGPASTIVVTHGNLLALILKHYDADVGFAEWKALSNPDVYRVRFQSDSAQVKRVWE